MKSIQSQIVARARLRLEQARKAADVGDVAGMVVCCLEARGLVGVLLQESLNEFYEERPAGSLKELSFALESQAGFVDLLARDVSDGPDQKT